MTGKREYIIDIILFAGITVLLLLLGSFLPFGAMLMPLPIILLILRRDSRAGLLAILIVSLPAVLLLDAQIFLAVVLVIGLIGFLAGNAFLERFNADKTFVVILLIAVASQTLYLGANHFILGHNIFQTFEDFFVEAVGGYSEEELTEILLTMTSALKMIFPTFVFISGAMTALINYYGTAYLAPKLNIALMPPKSLFSWQFNKVWLIFLTIVGVLYFITANNIFLNAALILMVCFSAAGLSVMLSKLKDKVKPSAKKIVLILAVLALLMPPIGALIMGLALIILGPLALLTGIADAWLNFRGL